MSTGRREHAQREESEAAGVSRGSDPGLASFGSLLEPVTAVPAAVFDGLPPVAQTAIVARVAPERLRTLDVDCCEAVLAVTQSAINTISALQDLTIAAAVRQEELEIAGLNDELGDGSPYTPEAQKVVASSLASIFHVAPRAMANRVGRACKVVDDLPLTLASALRGRLEPQRVAIIADGSLDVGTDLAFDFDVVLHADPAVPDMVPGRLRRAVERAAEIVDEAAFTRRAEAGLADRFVRLRPGLDPGMMQWSASLPSGRSAEAWAAVDALAREYQQSDGDRTIDQARADALLDLLLGQASVTTVVELVVPTFTHPGPAGASPDQSAEGPGLSVRTEAHAVDTDVDADADAANPGNPAEMDAPKADALETDAPETDAPETDAPEADAPEADSDPLGVLEFPVGQPIPRHPVIEPTQDEPLSTPLDLGCFTALSSFAQIGSELFGGLDPGQDGPPETWQWRPPRLGVRDSKVGWILGSALVDILTDPDVRLRITRADALTGITVARDPSVYRPNAALAQRIRDRDRTCRFPGCGVGAARCDIDHVIRFPDGSTTETNLVCLCRTHHGFKHHAGWRLVLDADGTCHWVAPNGRRLTTRPADLRLDAA